MAGGRPTVVLLSATDVVVAQGAPMCSGVGEPDLSLPDSVLVGEGPLADGSPRGAARAPATDRYVPREVKESDIARALEPVDPLLIRRRQSGVVVGMSSMEDHHRATPSSSTNLGRA